MGYAQTQRNCSGCSTCTTAKHRCNPTGNHLQKPGGSNLNESALIEEKDRAIRTLEGRVAALTQELATARIDAAAMRSELILAHAEANAAKSAAIETAKAESQKAADAVGAAKAKEDKKRKPADPALPPAPAPAPAREPVAEVPGGPSRIRRVVN
jgi:type IV secretory pathway VirB10-like protein